MSWHVFTVYHSCFFCMLNVSFIACRCLWGILVTLLCLVAVTRASVMSHFCLYLPDDLYAYNSVVRSRLSPYINCCLLSSRFFIFLIQKKSLWNFSIHKLLILKFVGFHTQEIKAARIAFLAGVQVTENLGFHLALTL